MFFYYCIRISGLPTQKLQCRTRGLGTFCGTSCLRSFRQTSSSCFHLKYNITDVLTLLFSLPAAPERPPAGTRQGGEAPAPPAQGPAQDEQEGPHQGAARGDRGARRGQEDHGHQAERGTCAHTGLKAQFGGFETQTIWSTYLIAGIDNLKFHCITFCNYFLSCFLLQYFL